MVTINWCKKQKNGIKLCVPSKHISSSYLFAAKDTLKILQIIENNSKIWTATMKYYFLYFLAYSYLSRVGISCEIHECTIKIIELLELEGFISTSFSKKVSSAKNLRINNQYYLKNIEVELDLKELLDEYTMFASNVANLTDSDIRTIRSFF